MLNSKKLIYIFSDVAYITELLPAKKEGDFAIQEFRQVNGEFLDHNELIPANIEKLFSKINPEEYTLILPDFLFTNTIIEIKEKAKTKVDKYITEKLLPSLEISMSTHQIKHFVLTQYGEKSKVQLSALEKSLLSPIFEASEKHEIKITGIASLSWTIKSLISLEPSLSVIQMGEKIYLAQHYIGIDQANYAEVTDTEKLGETIQTLKGAEPSIQTVYLLTNELVEAKLKEQLKATLPIQQLSDFKDNKSGIPSYVKQIIEAGGKTLSVVDFNVPDFKLEKAPAQSKGDEDGEREVSKALSQKIIALKKNDESSASAFLPAPTAPPIASPTVLPIAVDMSDKPIKDEAAVEETATKKVVQEDSGLSQFAASKSDKEGKAKTETENKNPAAVQDEKPKSETGDKDQKDVESVQDSKNNSSKSMPEKTDQKENQPAVIKNKTGVSSMLKMVFISITVFFVTIAVGVGLGLGFITLSQRQAKETEQTQVSAETSPSPTPSPTPSPEPEIKKAEISLLVVNATTKAGYASTVKKLLTTAEFTDVSTGNAKGDYKGGNYVLMAEENTALIKVLEEASGFKLEYSSETKTEDAKGKYDAIIVLAEVIADTTKTVE